MATVEGVDYAFDRPSITGLAQVGKRFACRYGGPGSAGKHLTRDEAMELTGHGLSIVAGAEGAADGLLGGYRAGRSWAQSAHDHYLGCGMPPSRPIYLAVDFDVQPAQWPSVRQALAGAGEVLGPGRVGVYGGLNAVSWAARDGVASWFWQTYAWSGGKWFDRTHIRQYRNHVSLVGGTVDLDAAMVSDYGQWTVGSLPPNTGGEDMSPEEEKTLLDAAFSVLHCYGPDSQPATALHVWTAQTNDRLTGIDQRLANLEAGHDGDGQGDTAAADLLAQVHDLLTQVRDTPLIDPVAVAAAIAARPEIASTLAGMVARQLAEIRGSITLSGGFSGGIVPPPE